MYSELDTGMIALTVTVVLRWGLTLLESCWRSYSSAQQKEPMQGLACYKRYCAPLSPILLGPGQCILWRNKLISECTSFWGSYSYNIDRGYSVFECGLPFFLSEQWPY